MTETQKKIILTVIVAIVFLGILTGAYFLFVHPEYASAPHKEDDPGEVPASLEIRAVTTPVSKDEPMVIRARGIPGKRYYATVEHVGTGSTTHLIAQTASESGELSWEWFDASLTSDSRADLLITVFGEDEEETLHLSVGARSDIDLPTGTDTGETETSPDAESDPSSENTSFYGELYHGIRVLALTDPGHAGGNVTLTVRGKPETVYEITVKYQSVSHAKGLETKVSDDKGEVSWVWRVGPSVKSGTYSITIRGGGEEITIPLNVQ